MKPVSSLKDFSRINRVCGKNPPAAFPPFSRAHVLSVRSARKNGCSLAGRTLRKDSGHAFLNRPGAFDKKSNPGQICP
jgi:hypothetical protein